jgi:2-oxoglutarate ferredoxin oxidoreductase subunit gamma
MEISSRHDIRLAGNGGQGVILATIILAEAAILSGKHTAQTGTYGPEARGGACKAEILISDKPIGFTKVLDPSFLLVFTKKALERYAPRISEGSLVMLDEGLEIPPDVSPSHVITLPLINTARNVVGKVQTANIVAIGAINEFLHIASDDILRQAVLMHVPSGSKEYNIKALEVGKQLALEWKRAHL